MGKCKACNGQGRGYVGREEDREKMVEVMRELGVMGVSDEGIMLCSWCDGTGEAKED